MRKFVAINPPATLLPRFGQMLQVSGGDCFSEDRWREAVLFYLNGVWGNKSNVMHRPKIDFAGITLRLAPNAETYFAYGEPDNNVTLARRLSGKPGGKDLTVTWAQMDVEGGLIRFVRDDGLASLTIGSSTAAHITLQKTSRRGEFAAYGINIPTRAEMHNRH